jgi:hypothetical protein
MVFNTSPENWINQQPQYDSWQAEQHCCELIFSQLPLASIDNTNRWGEDSLNWKPNPLVDTAGRVKLGHSTAPYSYPSR